MALKTWDDWKREQKKEDDFLKEVEETVKGFDEEMSPGDMKYEYYTKSEACGIPSLIDGGEEVIIPNGIDIENMPTEITLEGKDIPSEIRLNYSMAGVETQMPAPEGAIEEETKISFSKESWMEIQGIGSTVAERLVENGPYTSLDEIAQVKGVGKKALESIRHIISQIAPWEANDCTG